MSYLHKEYHKLSENAKSKYAGLSQQVSKELKSNYVKQLKQNNNGKSYSKEESKVE